MFESITVAAALRSELAALRAGGRDRSLGELVELVGACQSAVNQVTAVQMLAMAHVAAIEDVPMEDGTVVEQHRGLGHQRLDAPALVSDQLGVSDAVASSRLGTAVDVVTRVPGVFAAISEGRLDEYRARVVGEELREAPADVCAQVVAGIAESLGSEPAAVLRRRVRRVLGAVDPDLVRAKAARARAERSLRRWPGDEPGVDTWMGSFPAEQSRSGWAVIDGLAREHVREGKATGVEQARADVLMDLIHSRATGTFVVQLAVPADQLTASAPADTMAAAEVEDDAPVTVAGLGMPGTTQVRRGWVTSLGRGTDSDLETGNDPASDPASDPAADSGPSVRREVVACDTETGALMSVATDPDLTGPHKTRPERAGRQSATESTGYRPPAALVDLVKARDGQCRFPGCTVNARFCDLDHVRPWPAGPTQAANLMCLCRRHHRIKQTLRWRVRIEPNATVIWTDPTGRVRSTLPTDFLQHRDIERSLRATMPRTRPRPVVAAPVDEPGALWSVWEEELAHELTRAELHARKRRTNPRRSDEPGATPGRTVGRTAERTATLSSGRDDFALHPAFATACQRRRSRLRASPGSDPPF